MNHKVVERWEQQRDALVAEVAALPQVSCCTPGWEPVDLAMGLRWLQATVFEGYRVDHRVRDTGGATTVWFKLWEYGEPEPDWPPEAEALTPS